MAAIPATLTTRPAQFPQYADTVASVDTTGYWRTLDESPCGQGYHYNNNAETYMLVGDAMGRAMIELAEAASGPDENPPITTSLNPTNGASDVSVGTNLVVNFNELIAIGIGNITLRNLTDGPTGDVVIAVTDASQVSVAVTTLTVNPAASLAPSKQYAVRIDETAIDDLAANSYAEISDDATWTFSTPEPPPVGLLFADDFEFPDVTVAQSGSTGNGGTSKIVDTSKWVRANQGYGAAANGIEDEGAGRFTDPVGEQAYRFCYTNSGVTTAFGVIGSLTAGTTYTVSFDVVADSGATPYNMQFVTFNGAGTRNDVRSDSFVSKVLASRNGNAPGDGSYQTVSFEFTPDPALHAAVIGHDLALRFKGATTSANIDNVSVTSTGPGGPGPVKSFAISPIASPQTVGMPITGITLTAKDAADQTATGFTGTVTFGGTGGFSGTSASFTAGVLTGVSVTPTASGANLTLTVDDGAGHTGSSTIARVNPAQSPYAEWSGGAAFDVDANGDGVDNGLAWLLGAADPNANATGLLPTATTSGGDLVLTFSMLNAANRGTAALTVQ